MIISYKIILYDQKYAKESTAIITSIMAPPFERRKQDDAVGW